MDAFPALIVPAVLAYASTNVDGYVLLLGFVSHPRYRPAEVVAGQFASVTVQLAISIAIAQSGRLTAGPLIGLVGIVPLAAGLVRIAQWRKEAGATDAVLAPPPRSAHRRFGRAATVCAVATSGAVDNIFVYASVLMGRTLFDAIFTGCVFAVLTAGLCLTAYATARSSGAFIRLRTIAARTSPLMTTAIGLSVLIRFDTLPWLCSL
ncbi:hypothetical protein C0Z18_26035 [Trinickia dabaoshanensis]|uniref:Cadmium transporter n=1 Tax=Trinickia dabaoshanensis TaxID=564714 RepID=A0A2N7VEW6_9BURK|nr:hypothetical protein [Trinickia dabaoshanensis]PMS15698.1 hypothetical protein C0Z18_26035 [Trinickia dabaoshanensis]